MTSCVHDSSICRTGSQEQPLQQRTHLQDDTPEYHSMQQQQQQRFQRQRQSQNLLLARPNISLVQEQQQLTVEQPAKRRRAALLDDADTRMAAFDQLTVQVRAGDAIRAGLVVSRHKQLHI